MTMPGLDVEIQCVFPFLDLSGQWAFVIVWRRSCLNPLINHAIRSGHWVVDSPAGFLEGAQFHAGLAHDHAVFLGDVIMSVTNSGASAGALRPFDRNEIDGAI